MKDKTKRSRFRVIPKEDPKPSRIVQVMPGRKLRLDPSIIPDLVCWLMCSSRRWQTISKRTLRGLRGHERDSAKGLIRYAKVCLMAVQTLIDQCLEQWPIDDHESAMIDWQSGLARSGTMPGTVQLGMTFPTGPKAG